MYIIIIIDPLSQPGVYDIIKETNKHEVVNTLKKLIKNKLDIDTDFLKVGYNNQIINDNFKKYCEYIDNNLSDIENSSCKFEVKYYGYYMNQSYQYEQYDTLYNIHNLS